MRGLRSGGRSDNIYFCVDIQRDRRQTNFRAARLITQLKRDVLFAYTGGWENRQRQAKNDSVLINIERFFGKGKSVELAFGIGDFAWLKSGGSIRFQIGGDEVVLGLFAGVDMKAGTNFENYSDLK